MQEKRFELILDDFCEGCLYFEADVNTFETEIRKFDGITNKRIKTNIKCKNQNRCKNIANHIEIKIKEEIQNAKENRNNNKQSRIPTGKI